MTRPSRTGGKTNEAKARSASLAKGRKTTKSKRRIVPAATRVKRRSVSGPSKDLADAREQQAATAEILKIIASSPSDVQPVFEAIVGSAAKLFEPCSATITTLKDDKLYWGATAASISGFDVERVRSIYPIPFDPARSPSARAMLERRIIEIPDVAAPDTPEFVRNAAAAGGFRSITFAPLVDREQGIGTINFTHPQAGFRYSERQLALIQTFADQAVIALQNAQLFNETQETLERQTATAEILKVIASSPSDVQPVFDAIATSAKRLIGGFSTAVHRVIDDIDHLVAFTSTNPESDEVLKAAFPRHRSEMPAIISLVENGETAQIVDSETADGQIRKLARARGWRSATYTPLMNQGTFIGFIVCTRRETGMLADHHVQLLRTFADQAVIAIENARLFNETKEALERQTATADILKVIASSPNDVQPVFEAIAERSNRLIAGFSAAVFRFVDGAVHLAAITSVDPAGDESVRASYPRPIGDYFAVPQAGEVLPIADTEDYPDARLKNVGRIRGFRSIVYVPLKSSNISIGAIGVGRKEPGPFAAHHIDLLQTFADQAVIAIENVRLFNETREALERQTATADILKVIASSPDDVQPVFQIIAERSNELVSGLSTSVLRLQDDVLHMMAYTRVSPDADAALNVFYPKPLLAMPWGESVRQGKIFITTDIENDETAAENLQLARLRGWRSVLIVPLLTDRTPIGAISVTRREPGGFAENHVQLLKTFADQAVIAISNVGLFDEVQQRTRELSQSLDDLRNAQDRLIQTEKLASLGQLTAGIAHEIKNPLNFVNNFSALSAELVGEMNDVLAGATLDKKTRGDLDELAQTLKSNLEKVVQHGKRADSIVKNMLQHSREGSGEHRPTDINAIVDESLNLAYHGARAEKAGFSIAFQRDLDPSVGMADIYPQEITRVLLNLISNGFYATTKRRAEVGNGFEPMLSAATRNLGEKVEIRIRDNGTGIPDDVKEKIFNPFFTTKPSGEGTGLGLSMSHDIIVKQHGGSIDVATELGVFTEFKIVLPRATQM